MELGASGECSVAPILYQYASQIHVTCHSKEELPALRQNVHAICEEFDLDKNKFQFRTQDWFKPGDNKHDLVISNRVFGGLNRDHDIEKFRTVLDKATEHVSDNGHLVIVDKAAPIQPLKAILQKYGTAGKNGWHYFSNEDFKTFVNSELLLTPVERFGFLSIGNLKSSGIENFLDWMDSLIEKFFEKSHGPIFLLIRRK